MVSLQTNSVLDSVKYRIQVGGKNWKERQQKSSREGLWVVGGTLSLYKGDESPSLDSASARGGWLFPLVIS